MKGVKIMPLVAAKCTNCGYKIDVDDSKEAGICSSCGTAFITEKVINNYHTYNTTNMDMRGANVTIQGGPNLEALLKRMLVEIEGREFKAAAATCDKIADINIECPELWVCRLLIEAGVPNIGSLSRIHRNFTNSNNYKNAMRFAPPQIKEQLQKAVESAKELSYFTVKSQDTYCKDGKYRSFLTLLEYTGSNPNVVIPPVVEAIGENAFEGSRVSSITIPDTVKCIGGYAFYGALNIKSITIPDSVEFMGGYVFDSWTKNQTIHVNKKQSKKWYSDWKKGFIGKCKAKIIYR